MLTATRLSGPSLQLYARRQQPVLMGNLGELGLDIPGLDDVASGIGTMLKAGKAVYYVGLGTALIVASLFIWRTVDALFGVVE